MAVPLHTAAQNRRGRRTARRAGVGMQGGAGGGAGWLRAPVAGAVVAVEVAPGAGVARGATLLRLEAMKLEVAIDAPADGLVAEIAVATGDAVDEGAPLVRFVAGAAGMAPAGPSAPARPDAPAARLHERRALLADAARPDAVARRHASGLRTARENVADLLDPGSFVEYGAFAVAAQRSRRPLDDLQRQTPADGLVTGTGTVAGHPVAVMAYDYTVLAGTQGVFNHAKADRLLELVLRQRLPLVLFAEGGGGRPGDVDWVDAMGIAGLHSKTFARLAALSGRVPLVGIAAGWCFAGNAALLGCCDVVIAVEGASIGLGGPVMIEGGGLGRVAPQDVGPVPALAAAGAIDLRVADEAAAVRAARAWLSLAHDAAAPAPGPDRSAPAGGDAATLADALPRGTKGRNAALDPRPIVTTVFDAGSVIELRADFGRSLVTALARLAGRPVAVAASASLHAGGALDAAACDKLARFMQLADAYGWPLVTLVDTPGFMVGPASEAQGMLRHAGRVFVAAAALRVPVASVVLRRGYGLGAMALTAGHFHAPVATAAWPQAEFGAMGIDGAVRLGFRKELQAAPEGEREALFERLRDEALARGQALNMASFLEIDDVIAPEETRGWLVRVLSRAAALPLPARRRFIDPW
jgi:acetyl-CoA carboxylase carboxyltransferase component